VSTGTTGQAARVTPERSAAATARAAMLYLAQRKLAPTPDNYALAWANALGTPHAGSTEAGREMTRDARRLRHSERMVAELSEMVRALCEMMSSLAEDESWVSGQIATVRRALEGELDRSALAGLRALLHDTGAHQKRIQEQRRRTLEHLKRTLAEMAQVIAGLMASTDTFSEQMSEHAASIEGATSLDALSQTVRGLLEDTRTMRTAVDLSRDGLNRSQGVAATLEREVSRLEEQLAAASAEMVTDHLTRTMNRRGLEEAFLGAQERTLASGKPLTLALIDVDDFKRLNDALGHKAGDDALRHLADLLKNKLRPTDAVARYGGEEFVLLLPGASAADATSTVGRLQRELTTHVFMHDAHRAFITFSAGITEVSAGDSLGVAINRADEAMYRAKREGKNCVRSA
jgi:diguanylate cyclase